MQAVRWRATKCHERDPNAACAREAQELSTGPLSEHAFKIECAPAPGRVHPEEGSGGMYTHAPTCATFTSGAKLLAMLSAHPEMAKVQPVGAFFKAEESKLSAVGAMQPAGPGNRHEAGAWTVTSLA